MTIEGTNRIGVQQNPHLDNSGYEEPLAEIIIAEKPGDFEPKRTVVVPVDQSAHSEYTVQWAIENVIRDTDLVVLLNSRAVPIEFQSYNAGHVDSTALDFVNHKSVGHSTELLQKFGKMLASKGIKSQAISLAGDPRYVLVEKIHRLKPTMVVIGQRGMGSLTRAVLGSVSDYVVHHAHVPVTVVSQPKA